MDRLDELGPVLDAGGHVAAEDEVERLLVDPIALDIVDFKLDVRRDPGEEALAARPGEERLAVCDHTMVVGWRSDHCLESIRHVSGWSNNYRTDLVNSNAHDMPLRWDTRRP